MLVRDRVGAGILRCVDQVERVFAPMLGLPSWGGVAFHGSMFHMEFGGPTVRFCELRKMPTHIDGGPQYALSRPVSVFGEWTLSVEQCAWELQVGHERLAHSESEAVTLRRAVRVINGQALSTVTVQSDAVTRFEFDLGAVLTVTPYDASLRLQEPNLMWSLRLPTNDYFAVRDDRAWSLHDGDSTPDDQEWHPLAAT